MRASLLRSVVLSTLVLGIVSVWLMARPDPIRSEPSKGQQPTAAPSAPAVRESRTPVQPSAASLSQPSAAATERSVSSHGPASVFFETYPASAETSRIERLTGTVPRPHSSRDL